MYRDAVKYKGTWLAPGSQCLELYKAKKFSELDALIKELDAKWRKLTGRT
ncbi:DNA recombination-mediator protein A [Pseudomonas phage PPSC2]|uniref:DNA recombination-mediator protein A n=1 Tax=Pseudomonas phage PPSC2 TaxID=2041350 RepID=A0A2R2YB30_9CAUD|nr:DNA recombination-mediator protein A [Pseudomonas phage PPSC2]ATN92902.1 DNA recombination-mediator protein A [Pseudomonas phage PPSC2]